MLCYCLEDEGSNDGDEEEEGRGSHGGGRVALDEARVAEDLLVVGADDLDVSASVVVGVGSRFSSSPDPLEESAVRGLAAGESDRGGAVSVGTCGSSESGGTEFNEVARSSIVGDVPLDVGVGIAVAVADVPSQIVGHTAVWGRAQEGRSVRAGWGRCV